MKKLSNTEAELKKSVYMSPIYKNQTDYHLCTFNYIRGFRISLIRFLPRFVIFLTFLGNDATLVFSIY